jgi:hypothetical protein
MGMKRIGILCVMFLAGGLFAQEVGATLSPMLNSSYYGGSVYYEEGGLQGRIDFAVYDTTHAFYGSEYQENGLEKPGDGQYIYAYQIFNDYAASEEAVTYFALLGADGVAIDPVSIGAQQDVAAGVGPGSGYFDAGESRVVWEFNGTDGYIVSGEHSWFLVFSSTHGPTQGDFDIGAPGQLVVPAPEPCTAILLGLGAAVAMRKRTRRAWWGR